MSYDVYYSTGGGSLVYGGSDVWVNYWLENVAPKLDHPSKLLIHRRRPDGFKVNFSSPSEILWQGDDQELFNKYMNAPFECLNRNRCMKIMRCYYHNTFKPGIIKHICEIIICFCIIFNSS